MEKDLRDAYKALKLMRADLARTRNEKQVLEEQLTNKHSDDSGDNKNYDNNAEDNDNNSTARALQHLQLEHVALQHELRTLRQQYDELQQIHAKCERKLLAAAASCHATNSSTTSTTDSTTTSTARSEAVTNTNDTDNDHNPGASSQQQQQQQQQPEEELDAAPSSSDVVDAMMRERLELLASLFAMRRARDDVSSELLAHQAAFAHARDEHCMQLEELSEQMVALQTHARDVEHEKQFLAEKYEYLATQLDLVQQQRRRDSEDARGDRNNDRSGASGDEQAQQEQQQLGEHDVQLVEQCGTSDNANDDDAKADSNEKQQTSEQPTDAPHDACDRALDAMRCERDALRCDVALHAATAQTLRNERETLCNSHAAAIERLQVACDKSSAEVERLRVAYDKSIVDIETLRVTCDTLRVANDKLNVEAETRTVAYDKAHAEIESLGVAHDAALAQLAGAQQSIATLQATEQTLRDRIALLDTHCAASDNAHRTLQRELEQLVTQHAQQQHAFETQASAALMAVQQRNVHALAAAGAEHQALATRLQTAETQLMAQHDTRPSAAATARDNAAAHITDASTTWRVLALNAQTLVPCIADLVRFANVVHATLRLCAANAAALHVVTTSGDSDDALAYDVLASLEVVTHLQHVVLRSAPLSLVTNARRVHNCVVEALARWVESDNDINVPAPPFGIASREAAHVLQSWSSDRYERAAATRWLARIEAAGSGTNEKDDESDALRAVNGGSTLELQHLTVEVKHAFLMLIVPILRRNDAVLIRVFTRRRSPSRSIDTTTSANDGDDDDAAVWEMKIHAQLRFDPQQPQPLQRRASASSASSSSSREWAAEPTTPTSSSNAQQQKLQIIQQRLQRMQSRQSMK